MTQTRAWPALMTAGFFFMAGCAETAPDDSGRDWATLDGGAPLIIAHRGASGYLPEHTIEAYQLAIEQGADIIEPDLVVTKDGVLIARHDRFLSTTTNVADKPEFADRKKLDPYVNGNGREDWWVEDFTLAEVKTLRARQPREGRPQEFNDLYGVPTFEEVLALAAEHGAGVYPETKHPGYFESIGLDFEAPLLAALEGSNAGPVFIQSFEADILKRLKGKTPHKLVQLVYEETPGAGSNIPLAEIAGYADGVGPAKNLILKQDGEISDLIEQAHRLGLTVHPWTFRDDTENPNASYFLFNTHYIIDNRGSHLELATEPVLIEYQLFYLIGVDGVFTDFPDTAVKVRDAMQGQTASTE